MFLYLRLAWRNAWRHRRRTLIVIIAIALAFSLMLMYDGMVAGFENAIYGNAIQVLGGNIQIHAEGYGEQTGQSPLLPMGNDEALLAAARALPQVAAATRRIETGGMATSAKGAFGVSILGIEPEQEQVVSLEARRVTAGRFLTAADADQVFIGKGLADAMGVTVGDRITLVGKDIHKQMRQRTMTVTGIYDIQMPEIEKRTVYISLAEAQQLYGLDRQSTEVALALHRIGDEETVLAAMGPALDGNEAETWKDSFPELLQAMKSKGAVMNVFSVIIVFIAGIGILNMLLMAVYERTREIGVLGALGMKPRQISLLFLLEGAMMGLVGLAAGILLGAGFNALLGQVGIDYSAFTGMTEYTALINTNIYPSLGLQNLPMRSIVVLLVTLVCSYYPARDASNVEPAHALHHV